MRIEKVPLEDRDIFRPILNTGSIYDAMAFYYVYDYSDRQIELYGAFSGRIPVGFIVKAYTGLDLFRPLLLPVVAQQDVLTDLLHTALIPNRPAFLLLPLDQRDWLNSDVTLTQETKTDVFRLDPLSYQPVINVLVQAQPGLTGWPRYEIQQQDITIAAAGVNWAGDRFVEVYLDIVENPRELVFGKSVLAALCEDLLSKGKIPLLRLDEDYTYRRIMLEEVGFQQTGIRLTMFQAVLANLEQES